MRHEALLGMTEEEIDGYARSLGVSLDGVEGKAAKVELIERRRERTADVRVLGALVPIPVKRLHDKRMTDRMRGGAMSDEDFMGLMRDLLGEDGLAEVVDRATDEDGTVDNEALALAYTQVITSDELKNF